MGKEDEANQGESRWYRIWETTKANNTTIRTNMACTLEKGASKQSESDAGNLNGELLLVPHQCGCSVGVSRPPGCSAALCEPRLLEDHIELIQMTKINQYRPSGTSNHLEGRGR